jgi:tyrosine-protein phosphatase YwqE
LVLDQLTRFQLDSISIVKEVLNKVSNLVTKRDQMLSILHFITRLEVSPDHKIVEKLAKGVIGGIEKLTYVQIATFLESLLSLDYKVTPEFSTQII